MSIDPNRLYLYNPYTAGYRLDGSGAGINFSQLVAAGFTNVSAAAVARNNPNVVYVAKANSNQVAASVDGGQSWTITTIPQFPMTGTKLPTISAMVSHAAGEVHLFQNTTTGEQAGLQGVWRSTDGAATWQQIVMSRPIDSVQIDPCGGNLAAGGTNKLWWAQAVQPQDQPNHAGLKGVARGAPSIWRNTQLSPDKPQQWSWNSGTVTVTKVDPGLQDIWIGWAEAADCTNTLPPPNSNPCTSQTDVSVTPWAWSIGPINTTGVYTATIHEPPAYVTFREVVGWANSIANAQFQYQYDWFAPPQPAINRSVVQIYRSNWDGSGTDIGIAGIQYTLPTGVRAPTTVNIRSITDDFCLVVNAVGQGLHKVVWTGTTGVIDSIRPSGLTVPWDVAIFDYNTYVAIGTNPASGNNVRVYRTTNGGGTWTLVQTIPAAEGFAARDLMDMYQVVEATWGSGVAGYMFGYADAAVRQVLWKTANAGLTWTSFANLAELSGPSGYLDLGRGGLLAGPTIPPAFGQNQASIVG